MAKDGVVHPCQNPPCWEQPKEKCPVCGGEIKPSGFNGELFCWGKCYCYTSSTKYHELLKSVQPAPQVSKMSEQKSCESCVDSLRSAFGYCDNVCGENQPKPPVEEMPLIEIADAWILKHHVALATRQRDADLAVLKKALKDEAEWLEKHTAPSSVNDWDEYYKHITDLRKRAGQDS